MTGTATTSKINTTANLKINFEGQELQSAIRRALLHSSKCLLKAYDLAHVDLRTVNTSKSYEASYSKFVELGLLKSDVAFSADFLLNAYACSQRNDAIPQDMFEKFFPSIPSDGLIYKKVYAGRVKRGIGLFLVSLHTEGAVTLPITFYWPSVGHSVASENAGRMICEHSELLSFIRSIETVPGRPQDPAFKEVSRLQKRTEWFATYGTRLLLATGWKKPEDANYDDFLKIFVATSDLRIHGAVSVFLALAEVLKAKFGDRVVGDFGKSSLWERKLNGLKYQQLFDHRAAKALSFHEGAPSNTSSEEAFAQAKQLSASTCHPEKLQEALSGLDVTHPLKGYVSYWLELQIIYIERRKRENYNAVNNVLGQFNLYLAYYIPAWFKENPTTTLKFPSTPDLLVGSVYVSRLLPASEPVPLTLMKFMNERSADNGMLGNSYYAAIKQLEIFFDFLVTNAHHFKDCSNFVQPLSVHDYPRTTSSIQTNKRPMPRRLFAGFLAYVEMIKSYVDTVGEKILAGEIDLETSRELQRAKVVCCAAYSHVASVPQLTLNGKTLSVDYIPSVFRFDWKTTHDGRVLLIPHPHALNQIIVALYTGLRHNHIQWLDAEKFDYFADMSGDYTQLLVNTDKSMKKSWMPHVNRRVIEILRDQLNWRKQVNEPAFYEKQFYNNNENTAYDKFLPLFATNSEGLPHGDAAYDSAWRELLLGFQGILPEFINPAEESIPILCKLLPPGIAFNDLNEREKLEKYQDESLRKVVLNVVTEITPHSARVMVVSDLVHHLPLHLIGKYVTGQKEGTVPHYVRIDPEDQEAQQVYQAMDMRKRAVKQRMNDFVTSDKPSDPSFIKADEVNSRLARSMRVDVQETIARYGCVSLVMGEGKIGLDVLQERGADQISYNKTEICPFGNKCPDDVLKRLKGFNRCSICPYAVRCIDHLPAIAARKNSVKETLDELGDKLRAGLAEKSYTPDELAALEDERLRLSDEIAGWELCEEVLEQARLQRVEGDDSRGWVVEEPEILRQRLQRADTEISDQMSYLISRLMECQAYPGYQSPLIAKKFELLRRQILARAGKSLEEVLSLDIPDNSAAECAGALRTLAGAHKLTVDDVIQLLTSDAHLEALPPRKQLRLVNGQT